MKESEYKERIDDSVYEFTGNSLQGHFKYLGKLGQLAINVLEFTPITKQEAGISERYHDFNKNWDTGDFYLSGAKNEFGGGKGYALMINGYAQFYKAGDKIYYVGGFSIL